MIERKTIILAYPRFPSRPSRRPKAVGRPAIRRFPLPSVVLGMLMLAILPICAQAAEKEVSSFVCPGAHSPAITQAAFDAMPADYRKHFHALRRQFQADVICGQRLDDLLSLDSHTVVSLGADRAATLDEVKLLLKAGEQPRDREGRITWWSAARHWLMWNRPQFDNSPSVPLQAEYFTTFNEYILPNLPKPQKNDQSNVADVARYVLRMPEAQAIHALSHLQALGALDLGSSYNTIAQQTLSSAIARDVPQAVFDLLWKAANPSQNYARSLFVTAIDNSQGDTAGVDRLIAYGMDPTDADLLLRARDRPKLYSTLLGAVFEHAQAKGGKLPPEVVARLIRAEVFQTKTIDWNALSTLLDHGGDLSRSYIDGVTDERDSLAVLARLFPKRFLDLLNHGLRTDLPYPVGGNALLTRYLRLQIDWRRDGPRPDVVEAMLQRHNNAATGKPCTDCDASPLGVALGTRGPDSVAVLEVLLRYGADPNVGDDRGFPFFTYAVMDDRADMLEAMMRGPRSLNLNVTDPNGISLLALARCYDANQAADWLRQHGAGDPDQGYAACRQALEEQHSGAKNGGRRR